MFRGEGERENRTHNHPFPDFGSVCVTQPLRRIIIIFRGPQHSQIEVRFRYQGRHTANQGRKRDRIIPETCTCQVNDPQNVLKNQRLDNLIFHRFF